MAMESRSPAQAFSLVIGATLVTHTSRMLLGRASEGPGTATAPRPLPRATAVALLAGIALGLTGALGACGDYLDQLDIPILGVCAGHQFMARHFGGEAAPGKRPEFGQVEMTVSDPDDILRDVPAQCCGHCGELSSSHIAEEDLAGAIGGGS